VELGGGAVSGEEGKRRQHRLIEGARWRRGRGAGVGSMSRRGWKVWRGHGWWMGRPEVGDDPDKWVPPVGERERGKGEVGRRDKLGGEMMAGGVAIWAVGRKKEKKTEGEEREDGSRVAVGLWLG
jgi:hypothetical protein